MIQKIKNVCNTIRAFTLDFYMVKENFKNDLGVIGIS